MWHTQAANFRQKLVVFTALFALFYAVMISAPAQASAPSPRLKPSPPAMSAFMSESDARLFRKGLRNATARRWSEVERAIGKINDPTAKDILRWTRAANDRNAPLETLTYVHKNLAGWPRMTTTRAEAERRMFDQKWSASRVFDWFTGQVEPVSGEGRAALARAYYSKGDQVSGDKYLKLAWRESRLTRDRQKKIFSLYRDRLTKEDHAARADHLVWLGHRHFDSARALLSHMGRTDRALIDARMKLNRNSSGLNAAVNAVPDGHLTDPGFVYERARWRRKKKSNSYALPIYMSARTAPESDIGKKAMWREKKLMTYWAISENDLKEAYQLTLHHGFERGTEFAEAEFLGGWLALTGLKEPDRAIRHFSRLRDGVGSPISLSRAHYWLGRASEAKGDGQQDMHYSLAAQYQNTYYGMLAGLELEGRSHNISLPPEIINEQDRASFASDNRIHALRLLGEAGEERFYSQMSYHMDDEVESLSQLSLLSNLAKDYGFMRPSLRAAKQAGRFQSMLTESGYPLVSAIDALPKQKFEEAFVYAIARQESEFAPNAVSSARAYGMMQMINSTAKATARKHRIPYDVNKLATDGDYAAKMGALHLNDLLKRWDGSYILAAVSYNAGPHRAKQWIKKYGDPRNGDIDPIDWVEKIPFSETRNYVMRVLENMQVYRARLNNNFVPNRLEQDLRLGQQSF
jgi:soluble lytic murein transglycosylase